MHCSKCTLHSTHCIHATKSMPTTTTIPLHAHRSSKLATTKIRAHHLHIISNITSPAHSIPSARTPPHRAAFPSLRATRGTEVSFAPLAWGPNRYRPSTLQIPLSIPFALPCFVIVPTASHAIVHIVSLHCAPPARTPRGTCALLPTGTLASQTTPNARTSWLRDLRAPSTAS